MIHLMMVVRTICVLVVLAEIGAYNALNGAGLLAGGGNVPVANFNWNNSNISPSRPKKGKDFFPKES